MHLTFVSDIHLEESDPALCERFYSFLRNDLKNTSALYILGDLFDAWIGDDDLTPFHQNAIAELKSVTDRGIPLYIIHGNRDFLIGERFAKATGATLLDDHTVIHHDGRRILILHGDTLCTDDHAYQRFRRITRNRFYQKGFRLLPLVLRRKIANHLRNKSRQHTASKPLEIMDVNRDKVTALLQEHDCEMMIHGHTHRPAKHHFLLNDVSNSPRTRVVLACWTQGAPVFHLKSQR